MVGDGWMGGWRGGVGWLVGGWVVISVVAGKMCGCAFGLASRYRWGWMCWGWCSNPPLGRVAGVASSSLRCVF